jgi:hypothetical protein
MLDDKGVKYRETITAPPAENLLKMVRDLSVVTVNDGEPKVLMTDYELLCNVVHPSMGGFQLYSSPELLDSTMTFSYTEIGRGTGRLTLRGQHPNETTPTSFGTFAHSICRAASTSLQVYVSVLTSLVAIADDIAITAEVEPHTLHRTWRYPTQRESSTCGCLWSQYDSCRHAWGSEGPTVPLSFDLRLDPFRNPGRKP